MDYNSKYLEKTTENEKIKSKKRKRDTFSYAKFQSNLTKLKIRTE